MMRSAPYAIACKPDEQKRLTVTADASTGMPARKLAMRATFRPCSASGIAQPRITSSMRARSSPSTRVSAASIAVAASSSGRITLRSPFGALPTGVRTAETMTASRMEISKQVLDGLADQTGLAIEQVIGVLDDDQFLGFGKLRVEPANVSDRDQLVVFAMDDEFGER